MLFIQFQNIFHTPYGKTVFLSQDFFTDVIIIFFHLPQRDHLKYCKDCVKLETLHRTLLL